MRLFATMLLQPYSKKPLQPDKILPLPWEHSTEEAPTAEAVPEKKMTKAEHIERARHLASLSETAAVTTTNNNDTTTQHNG